MNFLSWLADELLVNEVKYVLDKALKKHRSAEKEFTKNVIDPFGALFESPHFACHADWKKAEIGRQIQKTVQNHIGVFHQKILGHIDGWIDLGTGNNVDLVCQNKKIIAEVKNKFSTVTGGKLADQYHLLDGLVSGKESKYKGYTAYVVNIIPKRPERINEPFTPSDKKRGEPCPTRENIRIIDGASFYHLVTGRDDALKELHAALPAVITHIYQTTYKRLDFAVPDKDQFASYFNLAYKNNHD